MTTALIVYTSLTGHTQECLDIVEDTFLELGVDVEVEEGATADAFDFEDYDICVVGTYTWGPDGDLPEEIIDFYEDLADADLEGKIVGAFGSGDTFYDDLYCQSVTDFEDQLLAAGGELGAPSVFVDLEPEEADIENLKNFARALVEASKNS